jgi:hypothetical protein
VGGACSTNGRGEKLINILVRKPERKIPLKDLAQIGDNNVG